MERDLRALSDLEPRNVCGVVAASIAAVATIGGAVIQGNAAGSAAKAQENAANNSTATQKAMYDLTRGDLSGYNQAGQTATSALMGRLGELTSSVALPTSAPRMTQADLESTPGYQFTRTQGLKAVQNSAAARGLGVSGAAMKGAANYATGLSDATYNERFANEQSLFGNRQQQYADQVTNQTNAYNRLTGVMDLGENAAAKTGNVGTQTANAISNAQIGAGNAAAGGIVGAANAGAGAFSNLGQLGMTYGMYGGFGGGAPQGGGYYGNYASTPSTPVGYYDFTDPAMQVS